MKSIFEKDAYQEITNRLNNLTSQNKAKWGKMNVTEMLSHCRKPLEVALQEVTIEKPNIVMRLLFKMVSPSLYNDKPWKQGLPTAKEFIEHIDNSAFEAQKNLLKSKIEQISQSEAFFKPSKVHPYFGKFNSEQWGKSFYKHLDHHFRQFGV